MSIIATVYLPEGIAMAADSRLTLTKCCDDGTKERYTLSDNSQKIFLIKNNTIGISCCGDAIIANKSVGDFIRWFEITQVKSEDTVEVIANKLKNFTIKNHGGGVLYHVAGYTGDDPYFYIIIDDNLSRDNFNYKTNNLMFGASWNGQTNYLVNLINGPKKFNVNWELMQLKDGIDLAEFMIDVTIKSQRFTDGLATCGGDIDLLVITKDYAKWIKHKVLNP